MKVPFSRRLFFYTLVVSFCVSTAIVLFLSFGYRFDWSRKIFVHSGSITIKTNPFKIDLKINGETPKTFNILNDRYEINGLFPTFFDVGNSEPGYNVEISAPSFKTWSKKVHVSSGKSTELWNVILVRDEYERTSFDISKVDNFFPAPEEFVFAYVNKKDYFLDDLEVGVIDTENSTILSTLSLKSENNVLVKRVLPNGGEEEIDVTESVDFTNDQFENIEWSPNNDAFIVPVTRRFDQTEACLIDNCFNAKFKDYLIFNLETNDYFYLSEKIDFLHNKDSEDVLDEDLALENNSSQIKLEYKNNVNVSENQNSDKNSGDVKIEEIESESEENSAKKIETINSLVNSEFKLSAVRWSPKEKNSVYFLFNDKLYSVNFDLEEKSILENLEIYPKTLAYDFADDGIYILDENGVVFYDRNFDIEKLKELTKFNIDKKDSSKYRLSAYDKYRIVLFENETGDCYLYSSDDSESKIFNDKLGSNIVNAQFSDDGKKLIYNTPSEIFIYFVRSWEAQPFREEGYHRSITRMSKKISNVHFAKDYEHIIFSSEDEIKIIDIDDRGQNDLKVITNLNEKDTKLISDHRNDVLYFLDKDENGENKLFRINFPEETTFLNLGN